MFKDDYKREMDSIKPSAECGARIKSMLENADTPAPKIKNPATPWRVGFALTAAAAIVLTVAFGNFVKSPQIEIGDKKSVLLNNSSYEDIYKRLDALRKNEEDTYEYEIIEEYSTVTNGGAGDTGVTAATGARDEVHSNKSYVTDDSASSQDGADYSETTTQVEGVDESDIVKTDGKHIYALADSTVRIIAPNSGKPRLVSTLNLPDGGEQYYHDMYLTGDRLVVMGSYYKSLGPSFDNGKIATMDLVAIETVTVLLFYDVSNPEKVELLGRLSQCGDYNSSRMIDGTVYVISNHSVRLNFMDKGEPETYIPTVSRGEELVVLESDRVMCPTDEINSSSYLVVCAYSAKDADFVSTLSILGSAETVYSGTENLITANAEWRSDDKGGNYTVLHRFALDGGKVEYKVSGSVRGTLINQFAIDEYKGYFRFVTTSQHNEVIEDNAESSTTTKIISGESTDSYDPTSSTPKKIRYKIYTPVTTNGLYVLDKDLNTVGFVDNLAKDERVYSVRFMGDTAYFVTFKQVDPLFSVDVSDPKNPKVIGELKIPGFSEYLYPYGDGLLLGIGQEVAAGTLRTSGVKLSMFDITDPANVTEKDKTVISGSNYAEALDNHKACIVNSDKNLIGFAVTGKSNDFGDVYVVYSYKDGGFTEIARIKCDDWMSKRGLFIGDVFYIVGYKSVEAFKIDGFNKIGTLNF